MWLLKIVAHWFKAVLTHTQLFNGLLSRTTRVGRYQKKHSPTHTNPDHQTSFINILHLLWSIASSLFNLHAWLLFHNLYPGPLWSSSCSGPLYFILHAFHFRNTCPYHRSLFCCSTTVMSSSPNLSLSSLLGNLFFSLTPLNKDHSDLLDDWHNNKSIKAHICEFCMNFCNRNMHTFLLEVCI